MRQRERDPQDRFYELRLLDDRASWRLDGIARRIADDALRGMLPPADVAARYIEARQNAEFARAALMAEVAELVGPVRP